MSIKERAVSSGADADAPDRLARKVAQQAAVAELGRLALTGYTVPQLLGEAVRMTAESLGTELAAILQPDESGETLICSVQVGWDERMNREIAISLDSQLGSTFLTGMPQIVSDLTSEPHFDSSKRLLEFGLRSAACVQIRGDPRPLGVLAAHSHSGRTFTDDDLLFLRGIANVLAGAAVHEKAERARSETARKLQLLSEASHALSASLDPEMTLNALARLVVPELADWCIVHLAEGGELYRVAVAHVDEEKTRVASERSRTMQMEVPTGPPAVFRTGESELVPEVAEDRFNRFPPDQLERIKAMNPRSLMMVPLPAREAILGTITFIRSDAEIPYTQGDLVFAEELGRRAGLAIDNARVHRREQDARGRAERLQHVTALLAGATTPEAVVDIVLTQGVAASGAVAGLVALVDESGTAIKVLAERGYLAENLDKWREFRLDANLPLSEAIRTGEALFLATSEERDARYPALRGLRDANHALAVVPLCARDRPIGGLSLSFEEPRAFLPEERPFLEALASQAAQALDRTLLAEAFEREQARFRSVLEQMPSGVLIAEAPSGRLILANEQVSAIWRRPFHAPVWAVGSPVGYQGFRLDGTPLGRDDWPLSRAIRQGEVVVNELLEIRRGDGTLGIASCSAAPIHDDDDQIVAGIVVFSDVTDQIQAQREIERRAEAARALAFVADGVCLVDERGVVRVWNRAAEGATGIAAAEIVGASLEERIPGWTSVSKDVPMATVGSGTQPRPATLPLELPLGERWLAIAGVDFGEGVVFAFRDVTEEQQLDALKSDFIATVSHELRTPLAAVYGAAATLRQRSSLDPEEREQFLAMIEEQAERLSRIVNEILIASRLESGELRVSISTVDAREAAEQVVEIARRGASAFEIQVAAADGLPPVLADPDRLAQVLGNLVENAIKYSGEGRKISLRVERADASVRFVVSDEGLGIAPAEHDRIFEKFYRVDPAMTGGVSGTGLGLYIVGELVKRMDGQISVESALGEGSSFVVELPAVPAPSGRPAAR